MKKLLTNPNNISAPNNTPDEEEILYNEITNFEEKYREKIPWIMAISQQLVNAKNKNPKKVIDTREHEFDQILHEPRLPEKPKPSSSLIPRVNNNIAIVKNLSSDTKKNVEFQPYKSTRPDLLQKLTSMITKGLTDLQKEYELSSLRLEDDKQQPPQQQQQQQSAKQTLFLQQKFLLYASVFERYIDESTLYQKILEEIHDGYHEYIDDLQTQLQQRGTISQILQEKDQENQQKITEITKIENIKYQILNEKNQLLEKKILFLENDKQKREMEFLKLKENYQSLKKEYDDLRATAATLTAGLSRMEEEHRVYQMNESNRLIELTHSKASEQKLNEEIERLQQTLQNMEQIQSSMVHQEAVTSLEANIETLKAEVKRMEATHRQLLLRYATVKAVIDDCFKKWESQNNSAIAQIKTREAVSEVIRNSGRANRKETNKSKMKPVVSDPIDQIMQIMEKQGNPKIIIETMLDHIVQYGSQRRFGGLDGDGGGNPLNAAANNMMGLLSPSFNPDGDSSRVPVNGTIGFESDGTNPVAEEFKSPWTHFDGLGYNLNIPGYLRFHGKIQNIFLSKRDIIKIIQEIWEAKRAYDQYMTNLQVIMTNSAMNTNREDLNLLDAFAANQAAMGNNNGIAGNVPDESGGIVVVTNVGEELNKPSSAQSVAFSDTMNDDGSGNMLEERKKISSRQQIRRKLSRSGTYQTTQNLIETTQQQNQEILNSGIITQFLVDFLPSNPTMLMFLEGFLQDKLKDKLLAIEMAYNIQDALKRFATLSDCRLFSAILDEKLPMEIWEDQKNTIEKVRDEVSKEIKMVRSNATDNSSHQGTSMNTNNNNNNNANNNSNNNNDPSFQNGNNQNKISADDLMRLMKRLFPTKTDHSFSKLSKAATMDNQNSRFIHPKDILYEDHHGNRPHFLEQLKLQHISEVLAFEKHLMDCIDQFNELNDKELMIGKFRDAIIYADSNKSRTEVNKLLARACAMSIEEMLLAEAKRITVNVEEFKIRLRSGLLQKSAPIAGAKK